jgi:hypothetical protein
MYDVIVEPLVAVPMDGTPNNHGKRASRSQVFCRRQLGGSIRQRTRSEGVRQPFTAPRANGGRVDRYYDPSTDQFLSVDPLVAGTGQPYAFTNDDPLNETDPSGDGAKGPPGTSSGSCNSPTIQDCVEPGSDTSSGTAPAGGNTSVGVPIAVPGPEATFDTNVATVTLQPSVTYSGANPSPDFTFTAGGGLEFDNGSVDLSGSGAALDVLGDCQVPVNDLTFTCTVNSRKVQVGPDTIQGQIVATEHLHPPRVGLDPYKVAVPSGGALVLWWLLKPVCVPAGPVGILAC